MIEQAFAGIPDGRKHDDLNSIFDDLRWSRIVAEGDRYDTY